MVPGLPAFFTSAVAERLTLLLNHVLSAEPVATARLLPHSGRSLSLVLQDWPALLPSPPVLAWRVTPAGLLEWCGPDGVDAPDLALRLDASNPALVLVRALAAEPAAVQIEGDAQLAADVNWLINNLRWDVAADLERFFGPVAAEQLTSVGRSVAGGLRVALESVVALAERLRSRQS